MEFQKKSAENAENLQIRTHFDEDRLSGCIWYQFGVMILKHG